jgi:hypothetical protein
MAGEFGRYHTLSRTNHGFIAPGQMRGASFSGRAAHYWITHLGVWAGRYTTLSASNVTTRVAVYAVDGSNNPSSRLGYSSSFTVTGTMNDASGGAAYTAAVSVVDATVPSGVTLTAIPLASNTRLHIAALGTVGYLGHGMEEAALIVAPNEKFYNRTGLSQPPPNPFGAYTSSTEGHPTFWGDATANSAPSAPGSLSPSGTINETAPTFTGTFADANSGVGDYLNQTRIQVRRVSDATSFWDTTVSSTEAERTGAAFSRAYGGTTLVRGTAYEWRSQVSDHFGAWSDWSAWTAFTPANLGFVTLDADPAGKIEETTPDFDGKWTHQSSEDMTHVQVRLLNAAGTTVLQTGAEYNIADVASSASPGTAFTVPWANTGFTTLAWGTSYQYQMRGKDESALWSDWSTARTFSTNAAPSVPANLSPANSFITTAYPLLTCTASDADDTTGTGFTVSARIKDDAGAVLFTRTMTYNSGTGKWEYQTDGTDLATYDTYRWDAYSYDGTLYSGEASSSGDAAKSPEASFIYALGPTVTITAPTEAATITTSNLTVTWTTTDQVSYRVTLYEDGTDTVVYDSGEVVSATGSHAIPSGYLRNDTAYDLIVWVEDDTPLEGTSAIRNITVDYVEPDAVANVAADTVMIGTDVWESAIRLTWDQTTYGTDVWQGYTITRQASGGPDATEIVWRRITSPSQVSIVDYVPASGYEYTYTITQTILTGLDELTSEPVSVAATVTLGGVVLCSVALPEEIRTTLRYTADRDYGRDIDESPYYPVNGAMPTTVRSRKRVVAPAFTAQLFNDDAATANVRRLELEAMDIAAGTLCYRDNHGRKQFVTMPGCEITDHVPDWFEAAIELRDERYTERWD